jgi:MFS family permease
MTAVGDLTRDVRSVGGWLRVGASRGAAIGVVTPPVCALVGVVVVLTADSEPLPAGTTTMSTQTSAQALAGLALLALYVAIAASVGSVVGAVVGAATAGLAGALDVATGRRLPAALLAGGATVAAGWVVQAVAIGWIPTSRPLDADAERAWRLVFACPFVLGLLSLALAPLVRSPSEPLDMRAAPL